MRPFVLRPIGWSAVLAFVLLAAGTQVARASCGDYLNPHLAMPATSPFSEQQTPAPIPRPCHGPNCSGREQAPVLPVAPSPTERDRPAALTMLIELPSPQCRNLAIETAISFASFGLADIFHPPR